MNLSDRYLPELWLLGVFTACALASLGPWLWMLMRVWHEKPILKFERRRPAPWRASDMIIVLSIYVVLQLAAFASVRAWLGPEITQSPVMYDVEDANNAHLVARLVIKGSGWILLLCGFSAVVVAPIVEEFMFRVVLQGYLEGAQWRYRKLLPTLRMLMPGAVGPILLTSLLFGGMHFRCKMPPMDPRFLIGVMTGATVASLLTAACTIVVLRVRAGATAADLGWAPRKFFRDFALGLAAFLALAVPVYVLKIVSGQLLPDYISADPFPLFVLSLALGTIYYYTHRIVPAIVAHMSLNATSLAMAWFMMR